ncbi:MAG: OpgC domain-containing protein [Chthoniobacterales bacterium]
MKRLTELDALRGILLLMMVVNHSPSSLRRFTDQPIGFFTTAEAFVFVSAFLEGMLFRIRIEKNGFNAARSSTIHRAGRIYCAHLLTLAFAFVIGSFLLSYLPGLRTLFEQYLKNPPAAIGASMLLVFQPPLMDVLPMYILFSFLTPLVFWAAGRWGWKTVIFSSLAIWLISQLRGARFTRHGHEGSLVHKSGAIRCSCLAIPLGRRSILRPASLREEARFAAADTVTGYLGSHIHSIFRLASNYRFSDPCSH